MKLFITAAVTLIALTTQAMDRVEQARVLEKLSAAQAELLTLKSLIPKVYRPVVSKNLDSINQKLQETSNIIGAAKINPDKSFNPTEHFPYPHSGYTRNQMSAYCYALTKTDKYVQDINSAGSVFGANVNELLKECFLLSASKYPKRSSVSVNGIQVVQAEPGSLVATCSYLSTFGGTKETRMVGDIVGHSLEDIKKQCEMAANDGFGHDKKIELTNIF